MWKELGVFDKLDHPVTFGEELHNFILIARQAVQGIVMDER